MVHREIIYHLKYNGLNLPVEEATYQDFPAFPSRCSPLIPTEFCSGDGGKGTSEGKVGVCSRRKDWQKLIFFSSMEVSFYC